MAVFLWHWLRDTLLMAYQLLWPLLLGFLFAAAAQAWLPRRKVAAALGGGGPRPVGLAVLLGGLSSSCSYAAVAMARALFVGGASPQAAFAFQVAATNVVWELAAGLLALLGWRFAVGELLGAVVMAAILAGFLTLLSPQAVELARGRAALAKGGHNHHSAGGKGLVKGLRSRSSWLDLAFNFVGDLQMLYREIALGLLLAGLAAQLPSSIYSALFLKGGPEGLRLVENLLVGPLLAAATFVCSIGNVAVAAVLFAKGATFAGVLAFLFADLLIPPLLLSYRRLYAPRFAAFLAFSLYLAGVAAALIVSLAFSALGITLHLHHPHLATLLPTVRPDYQLALNLVAAAAAAVLFLLVRRYGARDPSCGMWVEQGKGYPLSVAGRTYWFCGKGCRERFAASLAAGDVPAEEVEVAKG